MASFDTSATAPAAARTLPAIRTTSIAGRPGFIVDLTALGAAESEIWVLHRTDSGDVAAVAAQRGAHSTPQDTCPSDDPVLTSLASALLHALERGVDAGQPLVGYLLRAMRAHTALDDDRQGRRGPRLAPWQLRRVQDHIAAHAGSGITVTDLASVCRLSRSHFTRAFRNSTGETPRQWLTNYRLRRAQTLLHGRAAIADIAIECGFADQSHLTRTFTRALGTSPGAFRRLRIQEPACSAT